MHYKSQVFCTVKYCIAQKTIRNFYMYSSLSDTKANSVILQIINVLHCLVFFGAQRSFVDFYTQSFLAGTKVTSSILLKYCQGFLLLEMPLKTSVYKISPVLYSLKICFIFTYLVEYICLFSFFVIFFFLLLLL